MMNEISKILPFWQPVLAIIFLFLLAKILEKKWPKDFILKINLRLLGWGFIYLLFILLVVNLTQIIILKQRSQNEITRQKEATRPANLKVIQILAPNCPDCQGTLPFLEALKKQNVKIEKEEKIEASSSQTQELISQYQIKKLPVLILQGEIEKGDLVKFLASQGKIENGVFVSQNLLPPYFDLQQQKILGQIKVLTLLLDSACSECYQASRHEQILTGLGVKPQKTEILDINSSSGRQLLNRYQITLVPTFVLEGDLAPYTQLNQIWPQVGTKEADGSYVFRSGVKTMGVYKNVATGQIIKPPTQPTPTPVSLQFQTNPSPIS